MAIFGTIDAATFANNVAVTQNDATVTKNAADTVEEGDVLELGGVAYIVRTVTTTTEIELHTEYAGTTNAALAGAVRRTPPKKVAEYVIKGGDSITDYQLVFVDNTEDDVAANKTRGIWGPGWWLYRTYTDVSGRTRHKAECLAVTQATAAAAGDDADDTIVADVQNTITFTTNNTDKTASGGAATFLVAVSVTNAGTAAFQWQRRTTTSGRFTNVSGATSTSLALTGLTVAENGYQYRVKVTSDNGAPEVISDVATLTVS